MDIPMGLCKEGHTRLRQLMSRDEKRFHISASAVTVGRFDALRVTVTKDIRKASIDFLNYWPPETVQMNWDDLITWVGHRP